jgi:hypothetical protein
MISIITPAMRPPTIDASTSKRNLLIGAPPFWRLPATFYAIKIFSVKKINALKSCNSIRLGSFFFMAR